MSSLDAAHLYQLLPAVYRLRDAEQGYPFRALIEVLAGQAEVLEADITRLYENWFVETCDEWLVPYLGDLIGVRGLLPPKRTGWSQRALVANTLQYRQRKGTVPLLEQLVYDVTRWAARAVELYNEVGVTQHLNHLRPGLGGTAKLKELRDASLVGSAFDPLCYSADVRLMSGTRIAPQVAAERPVPRAGRQLAGVGQGRPNLPNIGLYLWRLKPYRLERVTAFPHGDGRFSFSPLGNDIPLFNKPDGNRNFAGTAKEHELPVALRNQALEKELEARRKAGTENKEPSPGFLSPLPSFEIYGDSSGKKHVELDLLLIADLAGWDDKNKLKQLKDQVPKQYVDSLGKIVMVDPGRGRIFFVTDPNNILVTFSYGFSNDIGGGPYDRRRLMVDELDTVNDPGALDTLIVIGNETKDPQYTLSTPTTYVEISSSQCLSEALNRWTKTGPAVIQIANNATYDVKFKKKRSGKTQTIELNASQLVIQAANLHRPTIIGDLKISGEAESAELRLSGLLIAGQIVISGQVGKVTIIDCTCLPGMDLDHEGHFRAPNTSSIMVKTTNPSLQINIQRSIVGPIIMHPEKGNLTISDSIIDADICQGQMFAIAGSSGRKRPLPAAGMSLERVTVFGKVSASEVRLAENVIFTSPVEGHPDPVLMRYCYVPELLNEISSETCRSRSDHLLPAFTSQRYGEPGYAQLSLACPAEIRAGGTDGAEMGVFHSLHQPQREGALLAQLEEYLRFGLEAGLIYVD